MNCLKLTLLLRSWAQSYVADILHLTLLLDFSASFEPVLSGKKNIEIRLNGLDPDLVTILSILFEPTAYVILFEMISSWVSALICTASVASDDLSCPFETVDTSGTCRRFYESENVNWEQQPATHLLIWKIHLSWVFLSAISLLPWTDLSNAYDAFGIHIFFKNIALYYYLPTFSQI